MSSLGPVQLLKVASRLRRPLHNHRHSRESGNPETSPKLGDALSTTPSQRENGYAKVSLRANDGSGDGGVAAWKEAGSHL